MKSMKEGISVTKEKEQQQKQLLKKEGNMESSCQLLAIFFAPYDTFVFESLEKDFSI